MYRNIAVAYDSSPEAGRALASAIDLAKTLGVGLQTVTVMERLPSYTAFGTAADATITLALENDRKRFYDQMLAEAQTIAAQAGVPLESHLLDGETTDSIIEFVCKKKIDLLVIGLHHRPHRVSSIWSTVYTVAQNVPCSVLGVP